MKTTLTITMLDALPDLFDPKLSPGTKKFAARVFFPARATLLIVSPQQKNNESGKSWLVLM
jgi:hypothetical protein